MGWTLKDVGVENSILVSFACFSPEIRWLLVPEFYSFTKKKKNNWREIP
jgi:hypothetical protein